MFLLYFKILGSYCLTAFLSFRIDRPLQGDGAILTDDLDVVGVCGQRLVGDNGLPDLLRQVAIRAIHLLLIGGDRTRLPISLVHLGIVRLRRILRGGGRRPRQAEQERRNDRKGPY